MILALKRTAQLTTLPLAISATLLFSGCATTVSPELRMAYNKTQQSLKAQSVGLVSDGCLIRVEMGKNDILYQQSDLGSLAMMHTVKEALNSKGLQVSSTVAPFVCGTLSKDSLAKMDILETADAKDKLNTAYPILSSTNEYDNTTNTAYLDLFKALDKDKRKMVHASKGASTALGLNTTTSNLLKKELGTDKVFVSLITGSKPSFGYSMAVGVASAVTSGGASYLTPQKGQFHSLYLVNLTDNTIEWGKSEAFGGKVFKMPVDARFNNKALLEPLYE